MDNHIFKKHLLNFETGCGTNDKGETNGLEESLVSKDMDSSILFEDVSLKNSEKYISQNEYQCEVNSVNEMSIEIPQRKSVICSVKDFVDVAPSRDVSDAEESSGGSSLVLEEDSDDPSKDINFVDNNDCEPSADPSEIECVLTDTSGDESSEGCDSEDEKNLDCDSKSRMDQLLCSLCEYVVLDGEGRRELLKHLQGSHKFAVRGLGHTEAKVLTTSTNDTAPEPTRPKKDFICSKSQGGCGSIFFSRKGLLSHHTRSKSAGSSCWMAFHSEGKARLVLSCPVCPFECTSRREMVRHFETCSDSLRDPDRALAALSLYCRVCADQFWTVEERSNHEVSEHPEEAAYLTLKCYICNDGFSSKVCLKKHVRLDHSGKEQFCGNIGFRCRLCFVTFPSLILVQEHFRKCHPSLLVFHCQKCSLILKTKKTYQVHLKGTQCGSVRQECTICHKVLWSKRALSIHYRMKHSSSSRVGFLCRICKRRFDSKCERKQHYATDHQGDSPFNCPVCNKGFASKSGMYGHRQTHVKTGLSKCEFCGKEFNRRDSYNEHLLIHTGPRHKCPHCDKEFVQRSNLVRHIRIHTGEKPYKCSFCEKTFSDKGACNSHIRVHTREEACGCPYCGQVFSKKQKLKYHIRKHTGEGLVSCEYCGKAFTNSHSLKEHRMIHDHRTQILCTQCGKSFSTAKYLQRHVAMVHEAIVVYSCPLCSRGFSQQGRLKTHLMTHTGIKHLQCLLCAKAYSSRKSLRHHLLHIHSVTTEHPDYKQCFYAMTPEEAGLNVSEGNRSTKQSLLKPKPEPLSADSDSEDKGSSSEEDDGSDEPPHPEQQEPLNSSILRSPSFSAVRTKAARKQLPFNVVATDKRTDKRIDKQSRGRGSPLKNNFEKMGKQVKVVSRNSVKSDIGQNASLIPSKVSSSTKDLVANDSSDFSSSGSLKTYSRKKDQKPLQSIKLGKLSTLAYDDGTLNSKPEEGANGNGSCKVSTLGKEAACSELSKSNRRARYKLQNPKKHVSLDESDCHSGRNSVSTKDTE